MSPLHHQIREKGFLPGRLTLLLLLALSTLFLCSVDKGYFHRPVNHDWNSVINLAIAENLSPDHGFRLFRALRPGLGGAPEYEMYSRFPVGGYALVKLAILPFGNDLSARILAARMLMLLLFSAAALLAFHSLARITSHRWIALAATLMAFSSYYMLFYGDAVSVEFSVDLFAVMLAFHGMVVFVQEGRFRQLLAKTCVALLLGWHVYAFLLPFILLGLAREAVGSWKEGGAVWPRLRSAAAAALWSRYMALGAFALLFGAAVLGCNFANEYAAFGGERPVGELPSFRSMLARTGLQYLDAPFDPGWWLRFLQRLFFRVCVASVPFVLTDWGIDLLGLFPSIGPSAPGLSGPEAAVYVLALLTVIGVSTAVVRLAGPLLAWRQRMLLAALVLSGFFWALAMRNNSVSHDHEALFYVGVPLVFYSLLLLYVHKRWGHRPVVGLAAAALLAFVVSTLQMNRSWRPDPRVAELQRAALAELGAIRETVRGKEVLVLGSVEPEWSRQAAQPYYGWRYYLAGSVWTRFPDVEVAARAVDFIVTPDRVESDALLTPGNEQVFLYDSEGIDDLLELYRVVHRQAVSGDPVARSHFDVYLGDDTLTYVREPCVREDAVGLPIFLEMILEDEQDLPGWRRRHGSNGLQRVMGSDMAAVDPRRRLRYGSHTFTFWFLKHLALFEGKCIAVLSLPDYPVSGINTGQENMGEGRLYPWETEIRDSR